LGRVIVIAAALYLAFIGKYEEAAALFGVGLSLIGIRHKLERKK